MSTRSQINCAYNALVSTDDLVPHPRNPNRHSKSQIVLLANLISTHGWRSAITVSNLSGYVIRGHGRLAAAKHLKIKEVPVDFQDYENEVSELTDLIADNKVQDYSELDLAQVRNIYEDFQNIEADLQHYGFLATESELLFNDFITQQENEYEAEVENKPKRKKRKNSFICPKCGHVVHTDD